MDSQDQAAFDAGAVPRNDTALPDADVQDSAVSAATLAARAAIARAATFQVGTSRSRATNSARQVLHSVHPPVPPATRLPPGHPSQPPGAEDGVPPHPQGTAYGLPILQPQEIGHVQPRTPPVGNILPHLPLPRQRQPIQGPQLPLAPFAPNVQGTAPISHTTFAAFFSDETRDPMRRSYEAITARFDAMNAAPQNANMLLDMAVGNPNVPSTFLCCATLHAQPRIFLIHSLSRYVPAMDGRVTPWDSQLFGFLGEIMNKNALTVILPNTIFDVVPATRVNMEDYLATALPTLPSDELFPRVTNKHQHGEQLITRYCTYLPTRYASLLLDNHGYSVKDAWQILTGVFANDGFMPHVIPILNWLCVSFHATQLNNRAPPATHITLTAPFSNQDLSTHILTLLHTALPGLLHTHQEGLDTALVQMAHVIGAQATEARTARLAREVAADQPTLPSAKLALMLPTLLSYLEIQDETELPDFWFTLAATPKKQEFNIIREAFDAYSRTPEAFLPLAPVPSPKLVTDLTSIRFVGDSPDDLQTGIQPFFIMDGSEEHRSATQELARSYALLSEQAVGLSYADLSTLKLPKDLRSHPINFFELEKSLGLFGNLLTILLGDQHTLTTHYQLFWSAFQKQFRLQLRSEIDTRQDIKPVHILRNIQLIMFHWFSAKCNNVLPGTPPFLDILISLSIYRNPTLPHAFYQLVTNKQKLPTMAKIDQKLDDDATTTTALSGLTSATGLTTTLLGAGSQTSLTSQAGTLVQNASVDSSMQALLPTGIRIRDLMGTGKGPLMEDGTPICIAFHVKGGCYTNCRRHTNHGRTLSPEEKHNLSNWLVDHTAKLRARIAGSG
jgi:hypothetical protein